VEALSVVPNKESVPRSTVSKYVPPMQRVSSADNTMRVPCTDLAIQSRKLVLRQVENIFVKLV
jgi:hypothetical protein